MQRRRALQLLPLAALAPAAPSQPAPDHVRWVAATIQKMQTIQPGMSRAQLEQVFTTEGGLSTALQRTFISRDCRYFKVDVTFRHAASGIQNDHPRDTLLNEQLDDVVVTISRPYLQFSITD